jgi:hypothetical protein
MQDFEASDGVAATNIDTTITATRMGSLRLSYSPQPLTSQPLNAEDCKLFPILKDNIDFKINHVYPRRCRVQRIPPRVRGDRVARLAGASRQLGANCIPPVASLDGAVKQPEAGIQDANRRQIVASRSSPARRLRPHLPSL